MKIRVTVKQLADGRWAAFTGKKYYSATVRDTKNKATVARLEEIGREAQDIIDAVDRRLEKLGALDAKDPHGYLA